MGPGIAGMHHGEKTGEQEVSRSHGGPRAHATVICHPGHQKWHRSNPESFRQQVFGAQLS